MFPNGTRLLIAFALSSACVLKNYDEDGRREGAEPRPTAFEVNGFAIRNYSPLIAELEVKEGEAGVIGAVRSLRMGAGAENRLAGQEGPVTAAGFGLGLSTTQTGLDGIEGTHALGYALGGDGNYMSST